MRPGQRVTATKPWRPWLYDGRAWFFSTSGCTGSLVDGLELLDAFKQQQPDLPIVMISGHGNIETAVAAIKKGAYDYIEKPFKADRLVLAAERALAIAGE